MAVILFSCKYLYTESYTLYKSSKFSFENDSYLFSKGLKLAILQNDNEHNSLRAYDTRVQKTSTKPRQRLKFFIIKMYITLNIIITITRDALSVIEANCIIF